MGGGDLTVKLASARQFDEQALAALLNRAYADYFMPVHMDGARFARMVHEVDVDLSYSVVALWEEEPVGLALLSRRAGRGWVSGVGVVPGFRRQGIARRILVRLQRAARTLDLRSLTLEVLVQNRPGLSLYRTLGFVAERELLILSLTPLFSFSGEPALKRVAPYPPQELLVHQPAFHLDALPWQREAATLKKRVDFLEGFGAWQDGELVGYILFQRQPGSQLVHDLAVLPTSDHEWQIAQALLYAVHRLRPTANLYLLNVPAEDTLMPSLLRLHCQVWLRQREMTWRVSDLS